MLHDTGQIKYGSPVGVVFFTVCMKLVSEYLEEDREILKQAAGALGRWMERFLNKGILAYDTWRRMLLEESYFTGAVNSELLAGLLAQRDVIQGLIENRNQEAKYLLELAAMQKERDGVLLERTARHFQKVSAYAEEIRYLVGEWPDMDALLQHLADRKVREELAELILYARKEDEAALQCLKEYLK